MKKTIALSVAVCGMSFLSLYADTFVWSGGANDGNKWSTPGNWNADRAPEGSDIAKFSKINNNPIVVDVDKSDCMCSQIVVESGVPAVSFSGEGVLTVTTSSTGKSADRNASPVRNLNYSTFPTTFDCEVVFSGANRIILCGGLVFSSEVTFTSSTYIWFGTGVSAALDEDGDQGVLVRGNFNVQSASAIVYMSNGAATPLIFDAHDETILHVLSNSFYCNAGSSVCFKRGKYTLTGDVTLNTPGLIDFRIDGGDLTMGSTGGGSNPKIATNGFNFVSGRLSLSKTSHIDSNASVVSTCSAMKMQGFVDGVLSDAKEFSHRQQNVTFPRPSLYPYQPLVIDGVYNHTNNQSGILTVQEIPRITGRGSLNARALIAVENVFEGLRLSLGGATGGELSFPWNGGRVTFTNMTLGCWGDWRNGTAKTGTFNFGGAVTVDTDDVRKNGESHLISLKTVVASPDLDLTVKGKGTVAFDWANGASSPMSLTVDDGATFLASNMTALAASALTFGKGSRLFLNRGSVRIPENATLSVTAALKNELDEASDMISVATAQSFEGLKNIRSNYRWKIRASATDDGFFDLLVGKKQGMILLFR